MGCGDAATPTLGARRPPSTACSSSRTIADLADAIMVIA
jgi:hypothetical protein